MITTEEVTAYILIAFFTGALISGLLTSAAYIKHRNTFYWRRIKYKRRQYHRNQKKAGIV